MKKIKVRIAELAGCPFCRSKEKLSNVTGAYLYFDKTGPVNIMTFDFRAIVSHYSINYCPFCGRKL